MFPIVQLESAFNSYLRSTLDPDEITPIAELARQWLVSFSEDENPHITAIKSLHSPDRQLNIYRLCFALSLSFCLPTADLDGVVKQYDVFLRANTDLMGSWTTEVASNIEKTHPADVLKGLGNLSDSAQYELSCQIYRVDPVLVRTAALACDNLKLFTDTLPSDGERRTIALDAIARFPIDKETLIYKAFIKSKADEIMLMRHRVGALQKQLSEEFTCGVSYLRPYNRSQICLFPGHRLNLERPSCGQLPLVCEESGFKKALEADSGRLIRIFFQPLRGNREIHPANWDHVDTIIRAFMGAGLTAERIVREGCESKVGVPIDLKTALKGHGAFDQQNERYFQVAFKAFIDEHDYQDVLRNCVDDKAFLAAYKATRNPIFIQAGDRFARESAIAIDLGL